jgi:hypothetical protein
MNEANNSGRVGGQCCRDEHRCDLSYYVDEFGVVFTEIFGYRRVISSPARAIPDRATVDGFAIYLRRCD